MTSSRSMPEAPGTWVVIHYTRGRTFPLRSTAEDHLLSFRRYGPAHTVYVNAAFGLPMRWISQLNVQAVILHTSLLAARWDRALFHRLATRLRPLQGLHCAKIALPQDEFINTDVLDSLLAELGATHVLSCAGPKDWPSIYPQMHSAASMRTVLTGYLEDRTVSRVNAMPTPERSIDIGYRAWAAAAWLGSWGWHKRRVADVVGAAARARGLVTDISLDEADALLGDDWLRFLKRCRATIGVEGGASVLDRDGLIRARVEAFLASRPDASYDDVAAACFPVQDGTLNLRALSPRHLEAALTGTAQLLLEGEYGGILEPWKHYYPLKHDYSNVSEALTFATDRVAVRDMAERAYADIVESGVATYRSFVADIASDIAEFGSELTQTTDVRIRAEISARSSLGWWERRCWQAVRAEATVRRSPVFPAVRAGAAGARRGWQLARGGVTAEGRGRN